MHMHAFERTLQLIDINKSATLFGWLQDMCNGEGHLISHHRMCFSSMCTSIVVYITFIHSYSRLSL